MVKEIVGNGASEQDMIQLLNSVPLYNDYAKWLLCTRISTICV